MQEGCKSQRGKTWEDAGEHKQRSKAQPLFPRQFTDDDGGGSKEGGWLQGFYFPICGVCTEESRGDYGKGGGEREG